MTRSATLPRAKAQRLQSLTAQIKRGEQAAETRAALILELRDQHYSLTAIANEIGCSIQAVSNVINKRRDRTAPPNALRPRKTA